MIEATGVHNGNESIESLRLEISGNKFGRRFLDVLEGEFRLDKIRGVDIVSTIGRSQSFISFMNKKCMEVDREFTRKEAENLVIEFSFVYEPQMLQKQLWRKNDVLKLICSRMKVRAEEVHKLFEELGFDWTVQEEIGLVSVNAILGLFYINAGKEDLVRGKRFRGFLKGQVARTRTKERLNRKEMGVRKLSPWRGNKTIAEAKSVEDGGEENKEVCVHHWVINRPNGFLSSGRCKRCGEVREFRNSSDRYAPSEVS